MRPLPSLSLALLCPHSRPGGIVVVGGAFVGWRSSSSSSSPRSNFHRVDVVRPLRSGGGGDDDEGSDGGEIFFDDFSGLSVGEVGGGASSSPPSPSSSFVSSDVRATGVRKGDEVRQPPELPDFDDDGVGEGGRIVIPLPKSAKDPSCDLAGSSSREFGLGTDVVLSDYAGSAGFDRVTDWQYYVVDVDVDDGEERRRTPVSPRPMDPSQPSRTRSSSGGVVRLFRGQLVGGTLGAKLRSRGLDARVWIKEYSGDEAVVLARAEKAGLGRLQSAWLRKCLGTNNGNDGKDMLKRMEDGEWMEAARRRYVDGLTDTPTREDDENLTSLLELQSSRKAQFPSLLGELNLNDYYDDEDSDPNEWYKSLGVKPPRPGSVWLVFDYHGTSTAASYAVPSMVRRSKLPPRRGVFGWGVVEPPPLPPFGERARYVCQGVLRGMMSAVATAHDAGIVHRSIGRNSFVLSSVGQDKGEATSPYAVVISRLRVVLSDWGFSALAEDAAREREFGVRSRMFGIPGVDSYENQVEANDRIAIAATEFAKAEDLHALGFV
jgi:hypothetical protein